MSKSIIDTDLTNPSSELMMLTKSFPLKVASPRTLPNQTYTWVQTRMIEWISVVFKFKTDVMHASLARGKWTFRLRLSIHTIELSEPAYTGKKLNVG